MGFLTPVSSSFVFFFEDVHMKNVFTCFTGNFGNGVLSYFVFLKSLFYLNIVIFLIVFVLLVFPQILLNHGELVYEKFGLSTEKPVNSTCPEYRL